MSTLNDTWATGKRMTTQMLIEVNPTSVALTRRAQPWRTAAGGVSSEGAVTVLPARNRYFGKMSADTRLDIRVEGKRIEGDYVLIGLFDDDIQPNDTFAVGNRKFKVVWVDHDRTYQVKALVADVGIIDTGAPAPVPDPYGGY